jgi:hypothetical protein
LCIILYISYRRDHLCILEEGLFVYYIVHILEEGPRVHYIIYICKYLRGGTTCVLHVYCIYLTGGTTCVLHCIYLIGGTTCTLYCIYLRGGTTCVLRCIYLTGGATCVLYCTDLTEGTTCVLHCIYMYISHRRDHLCVTLYIYISQKGPLVYYIVYHTYFKCLYTCIVCEKYYWYLFFSSENNISPLMKFSGNYSSVI